MGSSEARWPPGRGSSIESFPLFGYDLQDYDRLFAEKLDLLIEVNRSARVSWHGKTRPALTGQYAPPRAEQGPIPIWLGVGGNPGSVIRAAQLGLPMATGVLGGSAIRSAANAELYRRASAHFAIHPSRRWSCSGHRASSFRTATTRAKRGGRTGISS
ncbi:LLM class flavin-dependent oxidoreductase [Microbacterium sp. zg-YB36]|uniref:LLM class flavin-dependent oxidoreductase n=1 Tax=Microbacterium sp. zg-YB36 TaxID=2969407 RepID=UPI00336525B0